MVLTVVALAVLALAHGTQARGAGRAFPIRSENFAIDNFQTINPAIEWDPTNYLVDKSGQYANCDNIRVGYEDTREWTPNGQSIGAVLDYKEGPGVDVDSVNSYIIETIERWMATGQYRSTIQDADRFGCSVRPGCRHGRLTVATIACLFSPGRYPGDPSDPNNSGDEPTPRPTFRPRPPTRRPTPPPFSRTTRPPLDGGQDGLAFTEDQYDLAERITGQPWDESHYLENLSGFEISCSMLDTYEWIFNKAIPKALADFNMTVLGLKGEAPNLGSTQDAMEIILEQFKLIQQRSMVGCSVIPDCMVGRGDLGEEMWVVVTCIYEDPEDLRSRLEHERRNRYRAWPRMSRYH